MQPTVPINRVSITLNKNKLIINVEFMEIIKNFISLGIVDSSALEQDKLALNEEIIFNKNVSLFFFAQLVYHF